MLYYLLSIHHWILNIFQIKVSWSYVYGDNKVEYKSNVQSNVKKKWQMLINKNNFKNFNIKIDSIEKWFICEILYLPVSHESPV